MRGRVFRVIRGCAEREPVRVGREVRIASARGNRCYRAPETVVVLRIEASDTCVSKASPENRHETRRIRQIQVILGSEICEQTRILLRGVLGPEDADFGLLGCARGAVGCPQNARDGIVSLPR